MTVEKAVYEVLKADAGVGAEIGDRIYPISAPPSATYPLAVLQLIDDRTEQHLEGTTDAAKARVQVTVWARDYSDLKDASEAVRKALDVYAGSIGGETVLACHLASMTDVAAQPGEGPEAVEIGVAQDYDLWYRQSVAA